MAWHTLTEEDVRSALSDSELAALARASGVDGLSSNIALMLTNVTATVRGYVAGNPRNVLGPAGTIPSELVQAALSMIVVDLPARLGGLSIDPRGVRKDARREAVALLQSVSANKFVVEPHDGTAAPAGAIPPTTYAKPRVSTRDRQNGML